MARMAKSPKRKWKRLAHAYENNSKMGELVGSDEMEKESFFCAR
jgi:hypothetical protein